MTGSESEVRLDAAYIGKLERGDYRWPNQRYREALRIVLRAASDADLGFASPRRAVVDRLITISRHDR
ncbi:hypothetical protein [Micromonospora sp. Llam0]|uniref:hypothetical protein n=1 Tax=Micromonospora sp. Llam0 TaxID=2485143 RepID=UPI0011CEACE2|nr:hypothetical protein [Micromonospora sp. Llam0]